MKESHIKSAILQLEETLQILEESLHHNVFSDSTATQHIQRLKQFYSPRFDLEHSESGSYHYAALQCISAYYLEDDAVYQLPLSSIFKESLCLMLEINLLTLDGKRHNNEITEKLLALAELWSLNTILDMPTLLLQTHIMMRSNLIDSCGDLFKS